MYANPPFFARNMSLTGMMQGVECIGITAAWVVPTSNVTVNTFRKEFVPEMYQDLLPCTAEYCKIYNVSE